MTAGNSHGADRDPVDAAFDALDDGDPVRALEVVDRLLSGHAEDARLQLVAGLALLDLDAPDVAADRLRRAVTLDPDAAETRAHLSDALFRTCRFEKAEAEARRATETDPDVALAHHVLGLVLERRGRLLEADAYFARAAEGDPDAFARPVRMAEAEFARHVEAAIDALPAAFREALEAVAVMIEPVPPEPLLQEERPPLDPGLLGLFIGLPLTEQDTGSWGDLPPRIYLFQHNLARAARSTARLIDEIGVTLRHELAHYLGMDERSIDEAGHA